MMKLEQAVQSIGQVVLGFERSCLRREVDRDTRVHVALAWARIGEALQRLQELEQREPALRVVPSGPDDSVDQQTGDSEKSKAD